MVYRHVFVKFSYHNTEYYRFVIMSKIQVIKGIQPKFTMFNLNGLASVLIRLLYHIKVYHSQWFKNGFLTLILKLSILALMYQEFQKSFF